MIHLIQSDLHRLYKKETGYNHKYCPEDAYEDVNYEYSQHYINWLEEKYLSKLNQEKEDQEIIKEFNSKMEQIKVEEVQEWE